ncbi:MAG: glycosyltransferase family 39 protein [Bacillota bacterium]|nr:glycosyltransferase family 39 protein [Bacillota bacterium]
MNCINLIIVIITIIFYYLNRFDKKFEPQSSLVKKFNKFVALCEEKYHKIFVGILLAIGCTIRLWKFGVVPAGFNQDGAMGAVDALALANHATDRFGAFMPVHFTAWGFGQMSVLLSYLTIPFIKIFGFNRYTVRLPVVIISILAIWILYLLCKIIFNKKAALCILAFCAINPWHIMQSRWALDCNMLPHFLLFSIYFLTIGIKRNKIFLYISMLFFGFTMYTYGIAWYSIPLLLLITFIIFLNKNILKLKDVILLSLTYLFVAWPIFGVMMVNLLKLKSINTQFFTIPYFPDSHRKTDILFFSQSFLSQFKSNLEAIWNVVFLQKPDLIWNTIPEYGSLYLFSIPYVLLGIAGFIHMYRRIVNKSIIESDKAVKNDTFSNDIESCESTDSGDKSGSYLLVPLLIWFCTAVLSGTIINDINVNRINIIFYPLIIFGGLGIYLVIKKYKLLIIPIIAIYIIGFVGFNISYFGETSNRLAACFFDGFGEALEYAQNFDADEVYVTNWTQSKGSWWVSEPLVLFYNKIDALYYQGKVDAYSKSGKKLLPYRQRYKYTYFNIRSFDPNKKAVYVINNNELNLVKNNNNFIIVRYSYYSAVLPKQLISKYR